MSVNKAIIVGRLGKEPETRYTADNSAITNCTIATSESWKDKSGAKQEKTEWHRVVFFGKLAEIAGEYLKKGSLVYIEGKLQTRKWQNKDGADQYTTEIVADTMNMLGSKGGESNHDDRNDQRGGNQSSAGQQQGRSQVAQQRPQQSSYGGSKGYEFDPADVPF